MRKLKKLFHYEGEMINSKELDDDLRLASELIEKLKRKSDPREERAYRRKQIRDNILDSFIFFLIFGSLIFAFVSGVEFDRRMKSSDYISEAAYAVPEEQ